MTPGIERYDLVTVSPESPRVGEGDMLVLDDGSIFFAYGHFKGNRDDSRADIVYRLSHDLGRTWTEPELLVSNNEAVENVMSVSLLRLHSGGILLFYLRKDSRCLCRAWVRRSDDEGRTWSDAVCCTPGEQYHVIVNDCALQLADGRIILPYEVCNEAWGGDEHIEAAVAYSDDDGATWSLSANQIYAPKRGAMEAMVVEKRDGRLWMLMRTDQGTLWEAYSTDRGVTWSDAADAGIEAPQSPFVFKRIPTTGDILLIRNPVADMTYKSHQGPRTPLAACISTDDGQTWSEDRLLESDTDYTYCYAGIVFVEEADLAVLSYYVGSHDQPLEALRVARVPLGWFYGR